ncbi:MAG: DNA repair protein RadA [bacterium]
MFQCSKCDAQSSKWAGRCSECGGWGTLKEGNDEKSNDKPKNRLTGKVAELVSINQTAPEKAARVAFKSSEVNRVLGGGLVPGSVVLLSGEPGIGKSTLVLALANDLANRGLVVYASGEESPEQIAGRAKRLSVLNPNLKISTETGAENLVETLEKLKPVAMVVDSIQTTRVLGLDNEAGSPTQIKAAAATLIEAAKRLNIPVFLIGQLTKDGSVAGPKMLEHLVDVVCSLEGDAHGALRIMRAVKNRYGSTGETGIFAMTEAGLVDVANPSALLLKDRVAGSTGSVIAAIMEGSRPMFIEIQALTHPSAFQYPVRKTSGYDLNRLQMILAVLGKRARIQFSSDDVLVNVVGGVELQDPAADLAVALALVSSKNDRPLPDKLAAFGEVGLSGELRSVSFSERRLKEAQKIGFTQVISPTSNFKTLEAVIAYLKLK